jgi:hypothetical protein
MPQTTISTIWSRNGSAAATLTKKAALTTKVEVTSASRRPPAPQLQPLTGTSMASAPRSAFNEARGRARLDRLGELFLGARG